VGFPALDMDLTITVSFMISLYAIEA